jgi:hypothetical protein
MCKEIQQPDMPYIAGRYNKNRVVCVQTQDAKAEPQTLQDETYWIGINDHCRIIFL